MMSAPHALAFDVPNQTHDPDEGMEASVRLGIPEPMMFDLVRPLGAAKGEFEVNSLFHRPFQKGAPLRWAPEIEYAFREGTAIELELPFAGTRLHDYKVALQQKLPMDRKKPFTHGVQGIGEVARGGHGWKAAGLYIAGVRWHPQWSTLSMAGVQREGGAEDRRTSFLMNKSIFYERWHRTTLGFETNFKSPASRSREVLLMPQMHFNVREKINLQFGVGYTREPGQRALGVGWRLIREL